MSSGFWKECQGFSGRDILSSTWLNLAFRVPRLHIWTSGGVHGSVISGFISGLPVTGFKVTSSGTVSRFNFPVSIQQVESLYWAFRTCNHWRRLGEIPGLTSSFGAISSSVTSESFRSYFRVKKYRYFCFYRAGLLFL